MTDGFSLHKYIQGDVSAKDIASSHAYGKVSKSHDKTAPARRRSKSDSLKKKFKYNRSLIALSASQFRVSSSIPKDDSKDGDEDDPPSNKASI